jgi:hypothetical protein
MGEFASERENEDVAKWSYLGEDGEEHGFFTDDQMQKWYESGYFGERLQIREFEDGKWYYLRDYINLCNGSPFLNKIPMHHYANNEYFDQQRQITPIPLNIPVHPNLILPNVSTPGYPPNSAAITNGVGTPQQFYINPNSSMAANYGLHPLMMIPPGMEAYNESQIYQQDGYGNERGEHPSSSSVSETPDSERCLHMVEDMQITLPTFDKCVGTEDAPWLPSKVDFGTDTPNFPSTGVEFGSQTGPVVLKPRDVARLLKELTGISYQIR